MIYYHNDIIKTVELIDALKKGDVIIFRKLFFKLNFFKSTVKEINHLLNLNLKTDEEFIEFFDNFHLSKFNKEIIDIQSMLEVKLKHKFIENTVEMTKQLLETDDFWVNDSSLLRIMTPYKNMKVHNFSDKYKGRLELHDPHIDSQQSVAHNAVNFWIPISNINAENSLLVYSDAFGREIDSVNGKITKEAFLGKPSIIECEVGDVVIFNSDLAHSSIINTSQKTRWVITNRITLGDPEHSRKFFPLKYYDARLVKNLEQFYNSYKKDRAKIKNFLIIFEFYIYQILTKYLKIKKNNLIIGLLTKLFNLIGLKSNKKKLRLYKPNSFNNIKVEGKYCSIKIKNKVHRFKRYCPHKGADLSNAYVYNNKIYCPWHNYCFDLEKTSNVSDIFKLNISSNDVND